MMLRLAKHCFALTSGQSRMQAAWRMMSHGLMTADIVNTR